MRSVGGVWAGCEECGWVGCEECGWGGQGMRCVGGVGFLRVTVYVCTYVSVRGSGLCIEEVGWVISVEGMAGLYFTPYHSLRSAPSVFSLSSFSPHTQICWHSVCPPTGTSWCQWPCRSLCGLLPHCIQQEVVIVIG